MLVRGYIVFVQPISEDAAAGYAAIVSGLPGCVCEGETPEEAFERAEPAIASWIAHAKKLERLTRSS